MASISPNNQLPFPGSPLYQLLSQNIGKTISIQTMNGEIAGTLSGVNTGYITVVQEQATELHIVFSTVIHFTFT